MWTDAHDLAGIRDSTIELLLRHAATVPDQQCRPSRRAARAFLRNDPGVEVAALSRVEEPGSRVMDVVVAARDAFLRNFRWTDGHADLAAVFRDAETLARLGRALAAPFEHADVSVVVAMEARGFVLGALCAQHLGVGLVLARKSGSVYPGPKVEVTSAPDWRGQRVEVRLVRVLTSADRVLLVDDWIETGSQALAVKQAIETCGAELVGTSAVVDDTTADVRALLRVSAIVRAGDLPAT